MSALLETRIRCESATLITLDGRLATVCGYGNAFGTVRTLDGKLSGEWSWWAIDRVISSSAGRFRL